MKRIVILGGGFAGLSAIERLRSCGRDVERVLVDERSHSEFLPLLPDVIGRRLPGKHIRVPIKDVVDKCGGRFVRGRVARIDLQSRRVEGETLSLGYDGLIIAAGAETHFHGHDEFVQQVFTLDSVAQAECLADAVEGNAYDAVVVVGAGYTGIEIATHVRRRQMVLDRITPIIVVELGEKVLPGLSRRLGDYCAENCRRMSIQFRLGTTVEQVQENRLVLDGGETIMHPLVIWSAGVRTSKPVRELSLSQTRQGRLETDEHLQVFDGVFAAGDSAAFRRDGEPLRMGVQFSIGEGRHAGYNMIRYLRGQPLKPFDSWDPGYIVPMANGRGCGVPLGLFMKGRKAVALHYAMCLFRSRGLANRVGVLVNLLGRRK